MTTLKHRSKHDHQAKGYQGRNAVACPNCLKRFRANSSGLAWHVSNVSECAAAWDAMPTPEAIEATEAHRDLRRQGLAHQERRRKGSKQQRDHMNAIRPIGMVEAKARGIA